MSEEITGQEALFDMVADSQEERRTLSDEIVGLRIDNAARINELRHFGRQMDPGNVALVRLDTVIDVLFGKDADDDTARLRFERMFEERMSGILDQALSDVRRQALLKP